MMIPVEWGRILDPCCRNPEDPHHVPDVLLLWHFRQSVFADMRGYGEPIFEDDFEGLNMIRAITEGPHGKERFELELEYRLLASEKHAYWRRYCRIGKLVQAVGDF